MNILRILTLNKHGDFEEVLFSSLLSYLLSPRNDHGLGDIFLEKVTKEVFPLDKSLLDSAEVTPERPLGNTGKVDILITMGDKVLAIEVKIWDRSAKNVSVNDEPQLDRYCRHLDTEFAGKDWKFIFLIPTMASRTCLEEFLRICQGQFKDKVKLMTWNPGEPVPDGFPTNCMIQNSVLELIGEVMADVKRVDLPLNTQWLLDSLEDIIPDLVEDIPERGRFPNRDCLKNLRTWPIFEAFFDVNKRWPISLHTVVGIPYGWGDQRSVIHGNSLYRIRTVTDYYKDAADQENYLPTDRVEIELWPDVYEASRDKVHEWVVSLGLEESALSDGRHLDANKNEVVKLVSIKAGTEVTTENVERFNLILKDGFRRLMRKE
ncbi:MAG: PD-(D/E)XK nuclease family protein [Dehalococcoidales bacterium]